MHEDAKHVQGQRQKECNNQGQHTQTGVSPDNSYGSLKTTGGDRDGFRTGLHLAFLRLKVVLQQKQ